MNWRLLILRPGYSLTLFAWAFGAILLGLGNAFIGPVAVKAPASPGGSEIAATQQLNSPHHLEHEGDDLVHGHHTATADSVSGHSQTASNGQGHHSLSGALPAHCLFCLDGLSPSAVMLIRLGLKPHSEPSVSLPPQTSFAVVFDLVQTPKVRAPPLLPLF